MRIFKLTARYPSEHQEQTRVVSWSQSLHARRLYPELENLISIPNGSRRDAATGAKLKAEGLAKGFPDLLFLYPSGQYHALAIEMKAQRKGAALRPEQRQWIERLQAAGYAVSVCYGAQAAISAIERYLRGESLRLTKQGN